MASKKLSLQPTWSPQPKKAAVIFEKSNLWIDKALIDKGKVFIHCVCGVSRSATIACAYYIKKYGWEPNFTISYLQSKRDVIDPNPGFRNQLQNYYEKLYKPKDFETLVQNLI